LFDEDAAELLDRQAPTTGKGHWPNKTVSGYGTYGVGASRFFYCAKASKKEKNEGMEIPNTHLTVKPLALMEYLITLITPTGGIVLDPFMGSGSTGCAAIKNGFDFIGIELEEESYEIAKQRIQYHQNEHQVLNTSTTS
jgi:site-specific DNA-methyltransferase (adenine-specific)